MLKWYFLAQWKLAQIHILKPGKTLSELTSWRPTSLLPITSKVFEKLLLTFENNRLITNHQFAFRQRYSTIEQRHRIVQRINQARETSQHCSASFLDNLSIRQSMAYWTAM
jgi:hypothetical protein